MYPKRKTIKNLDQLDKEIYRQRIRAKELEKKLDQQWEELHDDFFSLLIGSAIKQKNPFMSVLGSLLAHDGVQQGLQRISGHFAEKAAEGLESLLNRFSKPKE